MNIKKLQIIFYLILYFYNNANSQIDPRTYNHGVCIIEFNNKNPNYYLTWSSNYQYGWEHNIFNSIISFDIEGNITTNKDNKLYIGSDWDEAQEPVNATINHRNNYILSVWEDGSDSDAPNVRGQLHLPDGTIIKSNWIIAGGEGSQHSAQVAHIGNRYAIFYADEAPPATKGAVVKGKIINDITGSETQSISFTPYDEDHWWPIATSNKSNSRTLLMWGNDGYSVMGTILKEDNDSIIMTHPPKDYIINTQQYYYHSDWLEEISHFLIIARDGAYENIQEQSTACLIDTFGNITSIEKLAGSIIREAKIASRWDSISNQFHIFFPTDTNSLIHFIIDSSAKILPHSSQILKPQELQNIKWGTTGTWSIFVRDIENKDQWNQKYKILFIMNDEYSNNIIKIPVNLSASLFHNISNEAQLVENKTNKFIKLKDNNLYVHLKNHYVNKDINILIFNTKGQTIINEQRILTGNSIKVKSNNLSTGQYFYKISF